MSSRPRPPAAHNPHPGDQSPPSVAFLLSRLGYDASREMGAALAEFGLELRQFGLLRLLAEARGRAQGEPPGGAATGGGPPERSRAASQRALGALLDLTPNRMVALVDGLEARGLIERRPHPQDRRAHAIALTEAGVETLRRAMRAAITVETAVCAPLEPGEREQLLSLLRKLAASRDRSPGTSAGVHPGMFEPDGQTPRGA